MISDLNKGITSIVYNYLNLPEAITFGNGSSIEYIYNAAGVKLMKTVNNVNPPNVYTDYLDGFQYVGGMLNFFPTAEGYVRATSQTEDPADPQLLFNYVYNYTDHLGNIRLSYTKDLVSNELEILDESHYYPFGLKLNSFDSSILQDLKKEEEENGNVARPGLVISSPYNYKYNGKEFQDELNLNLYDYGARNYDPALGRWSVIDPMAEKSPSWTPYRYAFNNPMFFVDPTGMWEDDYQLNLDGSVELIQKTDDKSDTLYASNADGSVDESRSVTVDKANSDDSSVIGDLATNVTTSYNPEAFPDGIRSASTSNVSDAINVYSFVAKNSNVEWGMNGYLKNGNYSFSIYTGHNSSLTPNVGEMAGSNLKNLAFSIHSHKNLNKPSEDQGIILGDYDAMHHLNRAYEKAVGRTLSPSEYPGSFLLYAPNSGNSNFIKYWGIPLNDNTTGTGSKSLGQNITPGSLGVSK